VPSADRDRLGKIALFFFSYQAWPRLIRAMTLSGEASSFSVQSAIIRSFVPGLRGSIVVGWGFATSGEIGKHVIGEVDAATVLGGGHNLARCRRALPRADAGATRWTWGNNIPGIAHRIGQRPDCFRRPAEYWCGNGLGLVRLHLIGYFRGMRCSCNLRWRFVCAEIQSILLGLAVCLLLSGCGTTRMQEATEQLTLSSAVDNSIAAIDFRPLAGQRVYFDDTYIKNVKSATFVNADYVISSLRQQIMAAGCLIQEKADAADIIIEGRVGTLGSDDRRVTYGIPENNVLGVAATMMSPVPTRAPSVPEIAIARRDAREGAAKVAAFAYDRETRQAIWQSGISKSIATSRNTWVMGVGPFQGGSIRESSELARQEAKAGAGYVRNRTDVNQRPPVSYSAEMRYENGWPLNGRPVPLPKPPIVAKNILAEDESPDRLNNADGGLIGGGNGPIEHPQPSTYQR
jgi:hypothetical protein